LSAAEDVAQGVGFSDVPAWLPDDEGQFALVVEIARDLRAHHRLIVRDQGMAGLHQRDCERLPHRVIPVGRLHVGQPVLQCNRPLEPLDRCSLVALTLRDAGFDGEAPRYLRSAFTGNTFLSTVETSL